jgi:hypothetical protein
MLHAYGWQEYIAEHGDFETLSSAKALRTGSDEDNITLLYENFALSVFAVLFD